MSIATDEGSANVYADLGYPNASEMQRKSSLAAEIQRTIKAQRFTQEDAARLLGVGGVDIARILRGQFRNVTESYLENMVARLSPSKD